MFKKSNIVNILGRRYSRGFNEIGVLLEILETPKTRLEVVEATGIKRSTVYDAITRLSIEERIKITRKKSKKNRGRNNVLFSANEHENFFRLGLKQFKSQLYDI